MTMDLNHLHLNAADIAVTRAFYETWFGFAENAVHGETLFLRNGDGFDLALASYEGVDPLPGWFHFGFRLDDAPAVRDLYERMQQAGVALRSDLEEYEDEDFVTYRCADPDGLTVEVYWEP